MTKTIPGKIIGIRKGDNDRVAYVAVLISEEDACKNIKNGTLKLVTESRHGIQKNVIVKNSGRGAEDNYLTTAGDASETNNILDQPEV